MSVSLPSLFPRFGFCGAAVRAEANSQSPVGTKILVTPWCYIPSFLKCCFHTAGSLPAISHTPLLSRTRWQAPWLSPNTKTCIFSSEGTPSFRGMPLLVSFLLMVAALYGASHKQTSLYHISKQLYQSSQTWNSTTITPFHLRTLHYWRSITKSSTWKTFPNLRQTTQSP